MTLPKLLYVPAMCLACAGAFAQNPPTPVPLDDPGQLPAYSGRLQQFTLSPRGDIDGLILSDGTEVKTPPHLSTAIAYSVKPGDTVSVHGLRAAALPLVLAVSITDRANGRTIIDSGPPAVDPGPPPPPAADSSPPPPPRGPATAGAPPPPPGPTAGAPPPPPSGPTAADTPPPPPRAFGSGPATPPPGLIEAQGRVRMSLHSPEGEVDGALLEDGTVLRLPPPAAATFTTLLQPGQRLVAAGVGFSNALGKVLEVQQIGTSREQLSYVAPQGPPPGPPR